MTTHILTQLLNAEFHELPEDKDGEPPRGIPRYFCVAYNGEIMIYPNLDASKVIASILIDVVDKDGGR